MLWIIEAPGKVKVLKSCISKIENLAKGKVVASIGHLFCDKNPLFPVLKESPFEESEKIIKNRDVAARILSSAIESKEVILATDEDMEGNVIAYQIALFLKKSGYKGKISRAKIKEFTKNGVTKAFQDREENTEKNGKAGRVRAVVDKAIATGLSLPPFFFLGRVQSGMLAMISNYDFDPIVGILRGRLPADDGGHFFCAKAIRKSELERANLTVKEINKNILPISADSPERIARRTSLPYDLGDVLIEAGERFDLSLKETSDIIQKAYESGRLTYPRTDSRSLTLSDSKVIKKWAECSGAIYRITKDITGEESLIIKDSRDLTQGGHRSLRPTEEELPFNVGIPLDDMSVDDAIISIITRRQIESFGAGNVVRVLPTSFPPSFSNNVTTLGWEREIALGLPWGAEQLEFEQSFTPECGAFIQLRNREIVLIESIMHNDIGRPSTYTSHISNFLKKGWVDRSFDLTEDGKTYLKWVEKTEKNIINPLVSRGIFDAMTFVNEEESVQDQAKKILKAFPGIISAYQEHREHSALSANLSCKFPKDGKSFNEFSSKIV